MANYDNISLLIIGYDPYIDVWDHYFELLNKYWPDRPCTYLATNLVVPTYQNVNVIVCGEDCEWSSKVHKALKKIPTDYVVLLLEDFFTTRPVNGEKDERDEKGELLSDEIRLTPFGQKLRSTSIDELPELINIAEGDMAIVGPRPLLVEYLERYNDEQIHRHDVLPGLTGLAQANGRNGITWEEKFAFDLEYEKKITFAGDLKILIDTVRSVFNQDGISSETSSTMESFLGTMS